MTGESPLLAHLGRISTLHGVRPAVRDVSVALSYAELWQASGALAAGLIEQGIGGSRVGILSRGGVPWPLAFLGVLRAGGTAVALSPLHPAAELRWFVQASSARALLVSSDLAELADQVGGGVPVVRLEHTSTTGATFPLPVVEANGTALVLYTSGTTGKPKGVRLTHSNVLSLALTLGSAWGFSPEDVLLHTLPLHHLHGIGVSLLVALATGAETRLMGRFDAARVWEEMTDATVLMGVPTQHKLLFDAFDRAGDADRVGFAEGARKLRLVTSGSAALAPAVGERWRTLTGRYPLERYGMTEIGIVLSNSLDGERRPGSVGSPLPGARVKVVGEDGAEVPAGDPGELWVSAPTVFAGYDGDAAATASAFSGEWFRTGDTAAQEADGTVRILGRTSTDILKCGGYKLSALEIEDALREHPAVSDVAVVGIPDATYGEVAVAVVVPNAGRWADVEGERLREWAKVRIAPYKVPKHVLLRDELPRTPLGKVQKSVLGDDVARSLGLPPHRKSDWSSP